VNDPKQPPPDDFSQTTPYIPRPKKEEPTAGGDWEKTNYNYQPPPMPDASDWDKTSRGIQIPKDDYGQTFIPSQKSQEPDWALTQNNLDPNDFGPPPGEPAYGATVVNIRLPQAEQTKYQNPLPTPAQAAQAVEQKKTEKRGIPSWLLVAGGLIAMFLFAIAILLGVYFLFLNKTGFDVVVKGAQPNSDVFVDGTRWGVTSADGSIKVQQLKAGQKKIVIKHEGFADDTRDVEGKDGDSKEIIAQQQKIAVTPPRDECSNIKAGDFATAQKCANQALDNLKDPVSPDDLVKALNLYIINFDSGKFNIKPNDMTFIQRAASLIQKLPPTVILEVGGHTDNRGSKASNQTLSEGRANAVRDALVKAGVKESVLRAKGYGDSKPKPGNTNATDDQRFQNRRIEYSVVSK
jgi:outer membrane protein OmpA-like peptidoglycan-associated protein